MLSNKRIYREHPKQDRNNNIKTYRNVHKYVLTIISER